MNSFELFCEVLFELLLRSLLFSRTFYLRFASLFIALSRGDLFILSLLCLFVNPFFRFLLFLHFISLFLSLFVHFALLLCSFDTKSDNWASLSCHFGLFIIFRQKNKLTEQKLCESLEAPPRFELGNEGFADPCLTTWPRHHNKQKAGVNRFLAVCLERPTRLELATSTLARWRSTRWATSAYGASDRNRTNDTGIFSPLLYRLSYRGKNWRPGTGSNRRPLAWQASVLTNWTTGPNVVGTTGLEPVTLCL